jgi:hypothetical protein
MSDANFVEPLGRVGRTHTDGEDEQHGEKVRNVLSIATLALLVVAQSVLAVLELRMDRPAGKVITLGTGALMSLALGTFIGVSWWGRVRELASSDDRPLGADSDMDAAFDRQNRLLLATDERKPIQISAAHLQLSDDFMKDAMAGALSARGACDAAFESGYLALLSVLTRDERVGATHPSDRLVVLASNRLRMPFSQGVALATIRYSYEDWPSFEEVVAWAEEVRIRAQEVESK